MTNKTTFDAIRARIDAATTAIAVRIRALKDKVLGGSMDGDTEAAVAEEFDALAQQLETMASDDDPDPQPA